MQRFFSPTTIAASDCRTSLCSDVLAALATRTLRRRRARGSSARIWPWAGAGLLDRYIVASARAVLHWPNTLTDCFNGLINAAWDGAGRA
jgi:hypothetical protein